jgi:hypothetical protein
MPFHHPASLSRAETIARLKDRARFGLDRTSKTMFSQPCLVTFCDGDTPCAPVAQAELLDAMRQHQFTDDAHRERELGEMVFRDHKVWSNIDLYDETFVETTNLSHGFDRLQRNSYPSVTIRKQQFRHDCTKQRTNELRDNKKRRVMRGDTGERVG